MPYVSIETNQTIDQRSNRDMMTKASAFIAELLGKPESYVMISIKPGTPLLFGGSDEPAAFVRLKSIGLPKESCSQLSEKICELLEQELQVPKNRVFIDFKDLEYISSAGLRVILKATKALKREEGKMMLCDMQDYVKEVFEIAGFDSFLPIVGTMDDAIQSF